LDFRGIGYFGRPPRHAVPGNLLEAFVGMASHAVPVGLASGAGVSVGMFGIVVLIGLRVEIGIGMAFDAGSQCCGAVLAVRPVLAWRALNPILRVTAA